MSPPGRLSRLARPALRAGLPRRTIRLRLTAIYGGLFLLCGALLLAITYILVSRFPGADCFRQPLHRGGRTVGTVGVCLAPRGGHTPRHTGAHLADLQALAVSYHAAEMHQLLAYSGIALAVTAILAIGFGWAVAGRVLRPLRTITQTARDISATSLERQIALSGPEDELKRLADTFDELLARLAAAFDAQRRFVANASHELRTPLTVSRALLQAAATDPRATVKSLRETCQEAIEVADGQERLIEALLVLARSERGLDHKDPVDLAVITTEVIDARRGEAAHRGLRVTETIRPAASSGDPRLAGRMIANLIDNALLYNTPGGLVEVTTGGPAGGPFVTVANTGPPIPPEDLHRLFQPFERLRPDLPDAGGGLGLGLSIVQAIASAHDAAVSAAPKPGGGLTITVSFPPRGSSPRQATALPLPRRHAVPAGTR